MRKHLSKHEIKDLETKITGFGISISKKDEIVSEDGMIYINKKPVFFMFEDKFVPTLKAVLLGAKLKTITVDMGAVKFVVGGADIMRPGIIYFDDSINKGDIVVIVDANNKKPLAIGISLFSSDELKGLITGKAIKNIHYVGDKIWTTS